MAKRTGPTNPLLQRLIIDLKKASTKEKAPIWKRIAADLEKPSRQRRIVNLSKINQYATAKESVVVPGKVLGVGELKNDIIVAAWQFSESAKKKLKQPLTILELVKKNPKGKNVRIIG